MLKAKGRSEEGFLEVAEIAANPSQLKVPHWFRLVSLHSFITVKDATENQHIKLTMSAVQLQLLDFFFFHAWWAKANFLIGNMRLFNPSGSVWLGVRLISMVSLCEDDDYRRLLQDCCLRLVDSPPFIAFVFIILCSVARYRCSCL